LAVSPRINDNDNEVASLALAIRAATQLIRAKASTSTVAGVFANVNELLELRERVQKTKATNKIIIPKAEIFTLIKQCSTSATLINYIHQCQRATRKR
jgi:hypothetical protein